MKKKSILLFLLATILFLFPRVASAASNTPLYRLYHPDLRVHLYTKDKNEYAVLGKRGWNQEGLAWVTANGEGDTVYRLYHPGLKVHLYTKDKNEYQVLAIRGWLQEGTAFYSEGSLPIYRLYHTGMKKHLYTKDKNEYQVLATRGWKQEGIAFYGLTSESQKVTTETVKTTEVIPFKTITKDDKNLYKDETKVQTKGVNGSIETTYKVTYIDGIETKRIKIKESKKDPVDEVILKGTKDRIVTKTETKREILYFGRKIQGDDTMLQGETKIGTKGENGYVDTIYEVTYVNGVETERKIVKEARKEPIDEVTLTGNIFEYTSKRVVEPGDANFSAIPVKYIEDSSVAYGDTKILFEGEKGYYTVTERWLHGKLLEVVSKEFTPYNPMIVAMHPGDVSFGDKWKNPSSIYDKTLFKYLRETTEDERFYNANNNRKGFSYYNFTADDLAKIKSAINMDLVNQYFVELVNADRLAEGKSPVTFTQYGREIAGIRAQEQADYGDWLTEGQFNTRPDGSDWKTVDSMGTAKIEVVSSLPENIYELTSEKYLAMNFYYNNWKNRIRFSKTDFTTVSLGLGMAKGELNNSNSSAFGKNENGETVIIVAIAE